MKKNTKKEKGFLILIAVMVSMILLSIGMFIASVAVRERNLAISLNASQKAFYAADSALECAMYKEFQEGGFSERGYTDCSSDEAKLVCNGLEFACVGGVDEGVDNDWGVGDNVERAKHVYYISYADKSKFGVGGSIDKNEMESGSYADVTKDEPYVKLIILKAVKYSDKSIFKAFGHNTRTGSNVTERAVQITI